jgi:transmembrane sensor
VTEGKVLVGVFDRNRVRPENDWAADSSGALAIQAGESIVLGDGKEAVKPIEPEDIEVRLSWRGGDLIFRGESLAEAIGEIERYTPVEFVILDDDLKKIRVAGLFKAGDVDGLLTTLKDNFNISWQRVGDEQIILTKH